MIDLDAPVNDGVTVAERGRTSGSARRSTGRAAGALVALLAIIGLALAARVAFDDGEARRVVGGPVPVSPAVEARWGVRVAQVGVSADGGIVDVRFVVLDPDRAVAMLGDDKKTNIPVLLAENNGGIVRSAALMPPKHTLAAGRTMYMLYRNTRGAIRRGEPVTFVFGKLRLEHVVAQ